MKSYRTHNPDVKILDVVKDGSQEDERILHILLKDYQYRTEWFYDNKKVHEIWYNYTKDMEKFDPDSVPTVVEGTKTTRGYSDFKCED